jgi:hypothetical protein
LAIKVNSLIINPTTTTNLTSIIINTTKKRNSK